MITVKVVEDMNAVYPMLVEWWKAHGMKVPPRNMLPKLGILALSHGIPAAFCSVFMDNSVPVCFVEFVTTNPVNAPRVSIDAAERMLAFAGDCVSDFGDGTGYGIMIGMAGKQSMQHLMERVGFKELGPTHTPMFRILKEA